MERFIFLTDTHGQLRDVDTIQQARSFAAWFKPDYLIGGGDFWDMRCIRRGADEEDQSYPLKDDIAAAEDTFDQFFGSYDTARKVYLYGNHDLVRVQRLLTAKNTMVREHAEGLYDSMRATVKRFCDEDRPYNKRTGVFNVGHFSFIHGYAHGIHAIRKHATVYGNCIFGHIHAFGTHILEDYGQSESHSCGCACVLDQEYNAAQLTTLRQEQGFIYGFIDGDRGIHAIHHAKKLDGEFYLPTEWTK